jgi:hypothetical protein
MVASPRSILTSAKSFADPWVGNPTLNRLGLHPARIALANSMLRLRRLQSGPRDQAPELTTLYRDGVVVLENFLPSAHFGRLQSEVREVCAQAARRHPIQESTEKGFGRKKPFDGGFDRYDGGTLNRFHEITEERTPCCAALLRSETLRQYCQLAAGYRFRPAKVWIGEIINGDQRDNPDDQKRFHRDTFHSATKLWYFTEDVAQEQGPFSYVPGSHRMNRERYRWEYHRSVEAARKNRGGAFRITEEELGELGLPAPRTFPVKANTLVIADVRGFHRRGDAEPGSRRVALHASFRPSPFVPVSY